MASGTTDKVKGRLKEAAGDASGDYGLKGEGKADRAAGKAKNSFSRAIDKIRGMFRR